MYLQYVLLEFLLHMLLTRMTSSSIHSLLFYIYSLLFVVLSLEAEDMTEGDPRISPAELWSVEKTKTLLIYLFFYLF